ncbi:MAG: hypothetical protein M1818_008271 [Claussenomyces sp. TS43310]|nr:MAG: hypothetical protein M1818_008271 [Claussenomyces sp. TS43310]
MERVLADIRRDTESAAAAERGTGAERKDGRTPEPITSNGAAAAAAAASNGRENEPGNIGGSASGDESLAVPRAVVDDGVRVTRECLDLVCEIED